MNELRKSFISVDKKNYIGICNNNYHPDSRATICVSVRRLKRILEAMEENDQPYVYLHIDDWKKDYNPMLRMSFRQHDDCNMLALAMFIVADYSEMKVRHNNNLLDEIGEELGLEECQT